MKVTMGNLNKNVSAIIAQICSTGESVTVLRHGKAIAQINPVSDPSPISKALDYLTELKSVSVSESVDSVLAAGRSRGL